MEKLSLMFEITSVGSLAETFSLQHVKTEAISLIIIIILFKSRETGDNLIMYIGPVQCVYTNAVNCAVFLLQIHVRC